MLTYCSGQNDKESAKIKETKNDIQKLIAPELTILKIDSVNIDSDQNLEFIISAINKKHSKKFEYWIKNNQKIAILEFPVYDIDYLWLADIDGDGKKEAIRAQGFEDGVDYAVFKLQDGKEIRLLNFNPALLDNRYPEQIFWAYPQDIKNLILKNNKIKVSLNNNFERDGKYTFPENQTELPFLFFAGETTQSDMKLPDLKEPQYLNYLQLKNLIYKTDPLKSKISAKNKIDWKGQYSGNFLRMKGEYADPRAYAMLDVNIKENTATFKLDSYMEIINKNLDIFSSDQFEIVLVDKVNKNSRFIIKKNKNVYYLKSDLLDKTIGESKSYQLKKK